ncbi:MAG: hypothetical protein K1X75_01435 [Leptospirales bacterium]|nr:hypothetical protein [Leptospirales bacterium]
MSSQEKLEMEMLMQKQARPRRSLLRRMYELLYCAILLINLTLVFFDASYLMRVPYTHLTVRDLYLQYFPIELHYRYDSEDYQRNPQLRLSGQEYDPLLLFYDPIKGIERHRSTDEYLEAYEHLRRFLSDGRSLESEEGQALLLQLSDRSVAMIESDPFVTAHKSGSLELIKNRMREHFALDSGKQSFRRFFSLENLSVERREAELDYFDRAILPTIRSNYFRWIDEDGEPKDHFHRFDLYFVAFFWLDFLGRWILALWRREHRRWFLFPVRQWHEVFLLFPPDHAAIFRLLRIIPFFSRMRENNFLPDSGLAPEIIHDNAAVIAEEISGMVLVNILAQIQTIVRERGLKELVSLNDEGALDELQDLLETQATLISKRVVPEIQPKITELVQYSLRRAMDRWIASPIGPGVRLALANVNSHVARGLESALAEEAGQERMAEITRSFIHTLLQEISKEENVRVLETQIAQLLEGVKSQVQIATRQSR